MNPWDILIACDKTSCNVLEDLHRLYERHEPTMSRFLEAVNRRTPIKRLDPFFTFPFKGQLFDLPLLDGDNKEVCQAAEELLKQYDERKLSPPYWLRILPTCIAIANSLKRGPLLRFISIAVEDMPIMHEPEFDIGTHNEHSYCALLNSRENRNAIDFGYYINEHPKKKSRVRVFAKLFYHLERLARLDNGQSSYPVYWGIRLRSAEGGGITKARRSGGMWLELQLAAAPKGRTYPCALDNVLPPSEPFLVTNRTLLQSLVLDWLLGRVPQQPYDFRELTRKPRFEEQVEGYCKALISHFPPHYPLWPPMGVDALIVPAVYWAPTKRHAGTAASIYWCFEGLLTSEDAAFIMAASHQLLSGVGQMGKLSETLAEVESKNERLAAAEKRLTQLRRPLEAANRALRTMQSKWHLLDDALYEPDEALFSRHLHLADLFAENKQVAICKDTVIRIRHEPETYQREEALYPAAEAILRICEGRHSIPRKQDKDAFIPYAIRTARRHLNGSGQTRDLLEDLTVLTACVAKRSLPNIMCILEDGDLAKNALRALKDVVFTPFKTVADKWPCLALVELVRRYGDQNIAPIMTLNGKSELCEELTVDFSPPISFNALLTFMHGVISYHRNDMLGYVSELSVTSNDASGFSISIAMDGRKRYIQAGGLEKLRTHIAQCMSGRWDWRTDDAMAGNFYGPYVRLCRQMIDVVPPNRSDEQSDSWEMKVPTKRDRTTLLRLKKRSENRYFAISLIDEPDSMRSILRVKCARLIRARV